MKRKIALLSSRRAPKNHDDELAAVALSASARYTVDFVPWNSEVKWETYHAAIIRSTWDYTQHIDDYLRTLRGIEAAGVRLFNSSSTVQWNHHKGYLKELAEEGVFVVPTLFFKDGEDITPPTDWACERFILKPCISASAMNTTIITREQLRDKSYQSRMFTADWMLQPFLENIVDGEISLHYFGGEFSHGVIKVPKAGDFRVQEEHGGVFAPYQPTTELQKLAQGILAKVQQPPLYARVDLIPYKNSFALMELELIEPFLNFCHHPKAPGNFLAAVDRRMKES
ncbi:MAG TPA: hypothetical protein VNJ01_09265 [Bacteriovoracaceae bacterium]|nr:hypothetical protein [Bacteriovoracaceae bacterium]